MACDCVNMSLDRITVLAEMFSVSEKIDVQIYSQIDEKRRVIYKFEPIGEERSNIVKVINYSDISNRKEEKVTVPVEEDIILPAGEMVITIDHPISERPLRKDEYIVCEDFSIIILVDS